MGYLKRNTIKQSATEHLAQIILLIMLFAVLARTAYFAYAKSGLFCDEVYSYGLANSLNYAFLGPASSTGYNESGWVDAGYFADYLICRSDERFCYTQTWENQRQDTLPPFYYAALHFACSLFSDRYTKLCGLLVNFVFWLLSLALLYRLAAKTLDRRYALFPCVLWGSSAACISMVTYIRMYTMTTCILLAFVNILLDIILQEHQIKKKQRVFLVLLLTAGTLTHYYFLVAAVFLAVIYISYLLCTKHFKQVLIYLAIAGISAGMTLLIFPDIINHLFRSDRGTQALSNFQSESGTGFTDTYHWMNRLFFGGLLGVFIILFAVSFGIFLYQTIKKRHTEKEPSLARLFLWILFGASVLYVIMIMKIAPFSYSAEGNRYMYPIYPLFALSVAMLADRIPDKARLPIVCALTIWIGFYTVKEGGVQFQYPETQSCIAIAQEDKDMDCIFVYDQDWFADIYHDIFCLMQYDEVYFIERDELDCLPEIMDKRSTTQDGLVVAYWDVLTQEEIDQYSRQIMDIMGYQTCEYRYCYQSKVYRFK